MNRQTLPTAVLILGLFAAGRPLPAQPAADQEQNGVRVVKLPIVCDTPLQDPRITPELPEDVDGGLQQPNFNVVQRAADIFSWQQFVSLNWPAKTDRRGQPDRSEKISKGGPRVWETWKEADEVYLLKGIRPAGWNEPELQPQQCEAAKVLNRSQKIDDELDADLQAAGATGTLPATLTDQHGNLVRYEIRMNQILFDYIVKNQLYNGDIQAAADRIAFPEGAMLIKASWREISDADAPRYLTVKACVCDQMDHKLVNCRIRKMGLVGLHIMHKTPSAPQSIWSTFEHVDNLRSPSGHPSFYNPSCQSCTPNQQTPPGVPNQVTRLIPIPSTNPVCSDRTAAVDNVQEMNRLMQGALAGESSVLQYYELVGTQWPVRSWQKKAPRPTTVFTVKPALLANTTMETFIQESSSCMGCHSTARTVRTDRFVSSDFSFTLNNAYPRQVNHQVIQPPKEPVSEWDRQNWNSILRGLQLTQQTCEQLPQFVPTAKLHCGSCHLNNGGNSAAAWWVGMTVRYAWPQTNQLQKRINGCFERSMNGKPLCDPESPDECDSDPNMNALITYMQWLDEQYGLTNPTGPLVHGFPSIPAKPISEFGHVGRGQAVFLQKCAFCHGPDGQGRYQNGVYFRPALWGPQSFNAAAGMAKPQMFAEFVRANMPHLSGGLLTDQEARDVAAFVDSQPRPGSYPTP